MLHIIHRLSSVTYRIYILFTGNITTTIYFIALKKKILKLVREILFLVIVRIIISIDILYNIRTAYFKKLITVCTINWFSRRKTLYWFLSSFLFIINFQKWPRWLSESFVKYFNLISFKKIKENTSI